jgi:drug/metabolite transporter (DMT)-like permease
MIPTKPFRIYLGLIAVSLLWGTSFAAAKIGLNELLPLNLVIFRFIIASFVFSIILLTMRGHNRIESRDIPRFVILGFLAITSYFYIQFTGLLYTTTINSALIIATSPIFTALFGRMLGWERISLPATIGIFIAFAGVSTIITNGQLSGIFETDTLKGNILLLLNAIVWAGVTVYGKTILLKYRPFVAMAYIHICGTILLIPFAFFPTPLAPVPLISQISGITQPTILTTLYLSLLCSVFAYHMWYVGVEKIGAVRTAVFTYLNPLFAMITGIWLLGEQMTVYIISGGLLIIVGVYITNQKRTVPQPASTENQQTES